MEASNILLAIRGTLGIPQAELARLAQLSPSTISRIETGALDPTWGNLWRILQATGHRLHGERLQPVGDPSAAIAACSELDRALQPDVEQHPRRAVPESVRLWLERWRRAGWITEPPTLMGLGKMASAAAVIAGEVGHAVPARRIGHRSRWREIALRIDEQGIDYAVSDLAVALELPQLSLRSQPLIYVPDPAFAAARLREEESAPGEGVLLVSTDGPELDGAVDGYGLRVTSLGQAIMDGFRSPVRGPANAWSVLGWLSPVALDR